MLLIIAAAAKNTVDTINTPEIKLHIPITNNAPIAISFFIFSVYTFFKLNKKTKYKGFRPKFSGHDTQH